MRRFTYPHLTSPSFYCVNESKTGLTLQYCSGRRGLHHYIKGQIQKIASAYYGINLRIQIISQSETDNLTNVIYRYRNVSKTLISCIIQYMCLYNHK